MVSTLDCIDCLGMHMMYGNRPTPTSGVDRFSSYPNRTQEPLFNRMNNDRLMMNYQNQYQYYPGSNQDNFFPYRY